MQTLSVDQLVGQALGNYRIERFLGQGRLNAVYLARSQTSQLTGALTLYLVPERFSPDARHRFIKRFLKEAAAISTLQHPHILSIYEYGEYSGYPYLITPYMMNGSLADIVKQQGRCSHEYALEIVEQVVAGVGFAHNQGFIHGTLKPSNLVLGGDQSILVAGFGLMHMLQVQGVEQNNQPYAHLLSIADTFLAAPEYIAPEVVQGQSIDKRSDIYALGAILFELLSGRPPFTGNNPIDVAKQHVSQSAPSLRSLCPDIPIALASVVNQALDRDPDRRFQHVDELLEAFSQVSAGASGVSGPILRTTEKTATIVEANQPYRAGSEAGGNWQLMPPIVTGHLPKIDLSTSSKRPVARTIVPQPPVSPPARVTQTGPVQPVPRQPQPLPVPAPVPVPPPVGKEVSNDSMKPFEWWSLSPQEPLLLRNAEPANQNAWAKPEAVNPPDNWGAPKAVNMTDSWGGAAAPMTVRSPAKRPRPLAKPSRGVGRRQVVALLAAGGVVAAGAVIAVNLNLVHMMDNMAVPHTNQTHPVATTGNPTNPTTNGKPPTTGNQQPKQSTGGQPANVIGSSSMALNSAIIFTNPADNKTSLLIRLPSGNFVAYERACTHEGILVHYDPATHTLVCPAHGSIFDPANGGSVLQGPALTPIPKVVIHVNGNGTITAV